MFFLICVDNKIKKTINIFKYKVISVFLLIYRGRAIRSAILSCTFPPTIFLYIVKLTETLTETPFFSESGRRLSFVHFLRQRFL